MAMHLNTVGSCTTWTEEGKAWLEERKDPPGLGEPGHKDPHKNREPFNLLWHHPPDIFPKSIQKKEMISPHSHPNFLGYCPKILLEGEKYESMKDSF